MIILHGSWLSHAGDSAACFVVWGEAALADPPPKPRGRPRASASSASIRRHPFSAPAAALRQSLPASSMRDDAVETSVLARLPSLAGEPLPSRSFIRERGATGQPALATWSAVGLAFDPTDTLGLLAGLPADDDTTPGVELGADLRFWQEAARFALHLLAAQRFTPQIVEADSRLLARWQPILDPPEDQGIYERFARTMPPICRALTRDDRDQPPGPRALLTDFLDTLIDAFARRTVEFRRARSALQRLPAYSWLAALASDDPQLQLPETFLKQYRAWAHPAQAASGGGFRICFRLDPPDEPDDDQILVPAANARNWTLRYFLQANDDPSLLVPAETVWRERGSMLTFLNRTFDQPQERLLAGLGLAARMFPPIEHSLRSARPDACPLTADEALTFLREAALLLQASGFGVLLPGLSTSLGVRVKLAPNRKTKTPTGGVARLSFDSIIQFDWELALGDQPLSRAEFDKLAALKVPLVRIRGRWVELHPEQLEQALAFWRRAESGQLSLAEALRMALAPDVLAGMPVTDVATAGWFSDLIREMNDGARMRPLPAPQGFVGTLRHYQQTGFAWLDFLGRYGLGACLADDMGTGKCASADTLVVVNGIPQTMDEIWHSYAGGSQFDGEGFWAAPTESLLVNAIDEETGRIVQAPIRRLYRQHVCEQLRKVRLEDGSSITITQRHRLLTSRDWTNDLHVGDYVCVPAKMLWDGQSVDPDLVTLLAWQIAEGYELADHGAVTITQKNIARLEELRQIFDHIGQRYALKINRPAIRSFRGKIPALQATSQAYRKFLEAKGYKWGKLSREKAIPPFIMQADLDSARLFLRNYFDAEASVVASMRSIEISTASPLLIQQLAVLLRRFGIWLRTSAKQKHATNGTGIFRTYQIGVIGGNGARRFLQEIGFGSPSKQQKLEAICEQVNNTNVEGVPASDLVAQMVKATGLPLRHFGMHNTVYLDGSQQFSRASLERVIAGIDHILSGEAKLQYRQQRGSKWTTRTLDAYDRLDAPQLSTTRQHLQHLLDQEVFYCKIKTIENVEYDGWVYDFEVAGHHNFVANNILCHNTIQTIALLLHQRSAGASKPSLLICPTSVVGNWRREVARFAPSLRVMVHHGAEREKAGFAELVGQYDLVLSSYALLHRDEQQLSEIEWADVILDEAQNIKNPDTKQAQTARKLRAANRIALTGTPVENRLTELWSIFQFLNPGFLGSRSDFQAQFARPIERTQDPDAARRLKALVGPFILRRVKTDPTVIDDLPAKNEIKVFCGLTKEQVTLYEAVVRDSLRRIEESDGMERRGLVLATMMKLKQICNHPAQLLKDSSALADRSGKLARLVEQLEELRAVKERTLIFTQFSEMGHLIKAHLQSVCNDEVLFLYGSTPVKARETMIRRFQEDPHGPFAFVLSIKAGGTGLNLTRANHVFHFDRWWNPAVENQATDRAFRIGQKRNVQVYKYICAGTLEERIDEMIERKQALAERIVGSSEAWVTELSTEQLRDLFVLRKEALA